MWRSSVLIFCLLARGVSQPSPSTPEQITVQQAVAEALEKNLGLLAEKANVSIAEARILQARLRPNPVLSFGYDYQDWLGSGFTAKGAVAPVANAGPPEVNARVDFALEGGGKRARRIEVASTARSVAELQFLNATRQVVLDVQSAFIDVQLAKESLTLARENLKSFQGIVDANTVRVRAGDLAQVELVRSRVAALQFQNAVWQAELRLRNARNRLQLLMGRLNPSDNLDVAGDLRHDETVPPVEDLRALAMTRRPDLQALRQDQARSAADIRLQIAQGKVDYSVGTQWHRQYGNAQGDALGLFFSVPLPVFNRNQGEVERARREHEQLDLRLRQMEASIRNEVDAAWQQLSTVRQLLGSLEKDMVQQAREVRDTTEYSYRRGEASFVEFLDAQRAFNDTMQSYNDARGEYARSLYLLDSVTSTEARRTP